MTAEPTVTVAIPVLNEQAHIDACLDAVAAQTYAGIVEVLVVDGGSADATRELVAGRPGVRLLDNPRRIQAAALNIALAEAKGDVFVRVDGHCVIAADYVERCVEALALTGAAMVGGAMTPVAEGALQRGIAAAMASKLGAGPARFHSGGASGRVDTVYLGAYPTELAREVGGYAEDVGVNEDAEFAIRMGARGPVWYDETIRSTYVPRSSVPAVAKQFYRYGRSRAATVRKHPQSIAGRQLVAPLLVLGLLSPGRRAVAGAYLAVVAAGSAKEVRKDVAAGVAMVAVMPAMHLSWGVGFLRGMVRRPA
ncbi:MAG TPA: glycosyltransferase family 2 protein [Acidimicrobiales bacterium]|nr:glycosyltransferase family 2 protein [Acidimicrobiales bacterium]